MAGASFPLRSISLLIFASLCLVALAGCGNDGGSNPVAVIKYHQVGACNGYNTGSGAVNVGPNSAYVVFQIETLDDREPGVDFHFDPARLFISQTLPRHVDPNLKFAQDLGVFGTVPVTVPHGTLVGVNGYSVAVVETANANGSAEAHQTSYLLLYDRQPSDPGILLVKTNASQTTWPQTDDCRAMTLQ
jgi:hypothetical protein